MESSAVGIHPLHGNMQTERNSPEASWAEDMTYLRCWLASDKRLLHSTGHASICTYSRHLRSNTYSSKWSPAIRRYEGGTPNASPSLRLAPFLTTTAGAAASMAASIAPHLFSTASQELFAQHTKCRRIQTKRYTKAHPDLETSIRNVDKIMQICRNYYGIRRYT